VAIGKNSVEFSSAAKSRKHQRMSKTFDFQSKLPHLPVPNLEETGKKYFKTLLPFLDEAGAKRVKVRSRCAHGVRLC
jgi:hypothetical protein